MEDGVHVGALVERIEQRSGDVACPFADNPSHGMRTHGVHQRLEGDQYHQAHQHVADGFQMVVLPIKTGVILRLDAIDVKLNGVTAITKPSKGRYSVLLSWSGDDDGCSAYKLLA